MKKITTLTAALLIALSAAAVPAKPVKRTLVLADGTSVTATMRGDEHFHFYTTDDGRALLQQADGTFAFADQQEINQTWTQRRQARLATRKALSQKRRIAGKPRREFGVPGKIVGNKRGLVILVNFKKKSMTHTQSEFLSQFNDEGYSKNKHIGSVRDYFKAQSYEQLNIDFDVVGPYTLSQEMAYYGRNAAFNYDYSTGKYEFQDWASNGDDVNAFEMIYEACKAADKDVNFKDYDWDNDGEVDQVYVIYAGFGEASGAASNTIWPHEFELDAAYYYGDVPGYPSFSNFADLHLDSVKINTYACSNELNGTSGTQMDGIGTACHEFTHCLGIPDFYDINYRNFGMGTWDLMDTGSYNGPGGYDGSVPAAYTAYERWFSGWLEPTVLSEGANIKDMPAITDKPVSYVLYNDAYKDEFYILQNIQNKSWNKYAASHGLMVLHVDYDKSIWQANEVNATGASTQTGNDHQRCTLIPADNKLTSGTTSGDLYPYNKVNSLTNTSSPKASLYHPNTSGSKLMNKPITDIAENDGLISFTFNGGKKIDAPTAHQVSAEDITETSFTATWTPVSEASSYTIELTEVKNFDPSQGELLLKEDFYGMRSEQNAGKELSSVLDDYTDMSGWKGAALYSGYAAGGAGGVKMGSGSKAGMLTTPILSTPRTGNVTLLFTFQPYGSDKQNLSVSIDAADGSAVTKTYTEGGTYVLTAEMEKEFSVTFNTPAAQRLYLTLVKVADGSFSQDDMEIFDGSSQVPARANRTTLFKGITDTQYSFTELTCTEYKFRVKAVDDAGNESVWSNQVDVELTPATAIKCIPSLLPDQTVQVYTLSGLLVRSKATLSDWDNNLPRGTYILKAQGATLKVAK